MRRHRLHGHLLTGAALALPLCAQAPVAPRELGEVRFARDLDAALRTKPRKPVFLLFQEIPGWKTCVDFGQQVLSHPLLVEAIQNEFVAVAIHNNAKGRDAEILRRYREPAWNNPVVRLVGADGEDLVPRRAGVYSVAGTAARMVDALQRAKRPVPGYLRLLALGKTAKSLRRVSFAMFWYWEGEAVLGALPGVVNTRAGWLDGKEVVEVTFDPELTDYHKLLAASRCVAKPSTVYVSDPVQRAAAAKVAGADAVRPWQPARPAKEADRRYYLRKSPYRDLPMTATQAVRLNALLGTAAKGGTADKAGAAALAAWLSPAQVELARRLRQATPKQRQQLLAELAPQWRRLR